jgi:hypothetical protein
MFRRAITTAAIAFAAGTSPLQAQDARQPASGMAASVAGAVVAFGLHESGHLVANEALTDHPYLTGVRFGPLPFFAIAHHDAVTPRQEYVISAAGFWVQEATNEWILSRHPRLREEPRPFLKGMFVFNVLLSAGYGATALLEVGPAERDPRSMANAVGTSEPVMGLVVLAPALLDAYRYVHPEKRWPVWASRALKIGTVALALGGATH